MCSDSASTCASSVMTPVIVITHRKGTMEEAHVLYGVTMQESGVFKTCISKASGNTRANWKHKGRGKQAGKYEYSKNGVDGL